MIDTAVILGAGRGTRLKELGDPIPKGFLRLGRQPIIVESIARLRQAGIVRIVIVTGHRADHYRRLASESGGTIELVHNSDYATSGSMYSLALAQQTVGDADFLLLESDLTYEQRALSSALGQNKPDVLLVSGPTYSGDEVHVEAERHNLVNLSKQRHLLGPSVLGELVGITRISAALYRQMLAYSASQFPHTKYLDYEQALVAACTVVPVHCHLERDLLWAEIDDETHLNRALQCIYPRIVERDRVSTR